MHKSAVLHPDLPPCGGQESPLDPAPGTAPIRTAVSKPGVIRELFRVTPHPGAAGYESVTSCLASPEVRARTEGVIAWRPQMA
jgi:hypothetical protein